MHRSTRTTLAAALVAATAALTLPAAAQAAPAAPRPDRVDTAPDGKEGNASAGGGGLSRDGRYVVFDSDASNLVAGDTNGTGDVFVRDLANGSTRRVSTGSAGAQANAAVEGGTLSANGRVVAFTSAATNLVPGGGDGRKHVYVKDLTTGKVQRINDKVAPGYDESYDIRLSADGRYAAFTATRSEASSEQDQWTRVYRHDRVTGKSVRVSEPSTQERTRTAGKPSISDDGSRVGYQFWVPFRSSGDWSDIHVKDVTTGKLFLADRSLPTTGPWIQSEYPEIAADGKKVVFRSLDGGLTPGDTNDTHNVFVRELATGALQRIDSADPTGYTSGGILSADNKFLLYEAADKNDPSGQSKLLLRDLGTGATRQVAVNTAGTTPDQPVGGVALDAHGGKAVFTSSAADLLPGDTYDAQHVYVTGTR
ncbi:TolB family protein [Streptomyces sp. NPDC004111]|uniref:TolB family protein n=1 Tax=Streptomyces sp. NPDC004111 TaxID=3364690 RepID=UPI0036BE0C86